MHGHCRRAREWVSAELDGELSTFERALLGDHLERCTSCRDFSRGVNRLTSALRAAPREPFEGVVIGRVRRQIRIRVAPAAAAMAIVAVGLGSLLASTQLNSAPLRPAEATTLPPAPRDFVLTHRRSVQLNAQGTSRTLVAIPGRPGPVLP